MGEQEHWSSPNRYRAIYDTLALPLFHLPPKLIPIRELLSQRKVLRIHDCGTGNGQAIITLAQVLRSQGKELEVTVSDLEDPSDLVFPTFQTDYAVAVQRAEVFDATLNARADRHFELTILGYLHPYFSGELFQRAIQERLLESEVVAIIPAGDSPRSPQSCWFICRDTSGKKRWVEYDPVKRVLR